MTSTNKLAGAIFGRDLDQVRRALIAHTINSAEELVKMLTAEASEPDLETHTRPPDPAARM
jgi:DNA-binding FadR family transcriptional regulator